MTEHELPDWSTRPAPSASGDSLMHGIPNADQPALSELMDALTGPATAQELQGVEALITAFLASTSVSSNPTTTTPTTKTSRNPMTSLLSKKLAAAAVAGGFVLTGMTGAAFAGVLPHGAQDFAHHTVGAPAADADDTDTTDTDTDATDDTTDTETDVTDVTDEGEDGDTTDGTEPTEDATIANNATGPAAFGLCNAFAHGGLSTNSTAYDNLALAAGGEDLIETYCATIVHPGQPSDGSSDVADGATAHATHPAKPTHPTTPSHPAKHDHPTKTSHGGSSD